MRKNERPKSLRAEPELATYDNLRTWLKLMANGANFRLAFSSGFFAASTLVWSYLPAVACPMVSISALTFGALIGGRYDVPRRGPRGPRSATPSPK